MDLALRPLRSEELDWCTLDDGGLLTDPVDGRSWSLNPVGLLIWDHCDGSRDIAQIEAAIQLNFDIDRVSAHRDLEAFLLSMEDQGLMRLGFPAAS